jgi:hypothetical protein
MAMSMARASSSARIGSQARAVVRPPAGGRSWRRRMSIRGAPRPSSARSGGRITADTPSGAPIVKCRAEVAGSNGSAVAITLLAPASTAPIGPASSTARAVGTTPFGVRRNNGSFSRRRSRPNPWLTAEADRFSRAAARPTCRSRSTVSNRTRRFRSARERSISFSITLKSYH